MENNPNKVKDKGYFLRLLKEEIAALTNYGQNENIVIVHNNYQMNSEGSLVTIAKYYNPMYDPETQLYTISRLIPYPGGTFASRLEYSLHDNSDLIYCQQTEWGGNLDGCLPVKEKLYTTKEEIEHVFRFLYGLQLPEEEAEKVLRKHRKSLKKHYGVDNGNIPPGKFKRLLDRIFHDIDE